MIADRAHARLSLAAVLLTALSLAPALGDVELTASTGTGVTYGIARELVYGTSTFNGQAYTVSELDWDIKPLLYAKAALALNTSVGFVASLDVRLGVPWRTGVIGDSDWLNYDFNGDPQKTNYSEHDCFTERAILLDAQAGWQIPVTSWATIVPYLSFGFMDFKWTARDGYLLYPPGYGSTATLPYPSLSSDTPVPASGTGIIYEQTYFIPALGCRAEFRAGRSFRGSVAFTVSPLVFCNDVDNHVFASKDFYDTMSNGLLLEPGISLEWQVGASSRLRLDVSYRSITRLVGNTRIVITGPNKTPGLTAGSYANSAGASYEALNASLSFTWVP
jgi:outer membrane protease